MDNRNKMTTSTCTLSKKFKRDSEADDLPDITPTLMSELHGKWAIKNPVDRHPISQLVDTLREHMDAINPYIEVVRLNEKKWYDCWMQFYAIAQELDHVVDDSIGRSDYSVPEELNTLRVRTQAELSKADSEWEEAKNLYSIEIDKRNQEMIDIQNKIKLITEAKDIDALSKYESNGNNPPAKPALSGRLASFFSVFGYHPEKKSLVRSLSDEDKKLKSVRDKLLIEYNDNLIFKTNSLNEYAERAPVKPVKHRSELKKVEARIARHRLEFYRCQSKEVMLQCLRLYLMACKSFNVIYGESPFAALKKLTPDDKKPIPKLQSHDDKIVAKAKELFTQMIVDMNNQLSKYYCLQPDRCEFTQYYYNFLRIPEAAIRDAILDGKADEGMLALIFTEFETPLEAFQLSTITP